MRRLCRPVMSRRCPSWLRHEHTGPRREWNFRVVVAGTRDRRSFRRRVVTLRVAHAVGRVSCGRHVACRVGGRDRQGEAADGLKPACRGRCLATWCPSSCSRDSASTSRVVGRTPFACIPPELRRCGRNQTGIKAIRRRASEQFLTTSLRSCRDVGMVTDSPLSLLSRLPSGPLRRAGVVSSKFFKNSSFTLL